MVYRRLGRTDLMAHYFLPGCADFQVEFTYDDPHEIAIEREGWSVRVHSSAEMTCDEDSYFVTDELEAFEDSSSVFRKSLRFTVPRDL